MLGNEILVARLRAMSNPTTAQKLETYRRFYNFMPIFLKMFEGEEKEEAQKALSALLAWAFRANVEYNEVIATGLETGHYFSAFFRTHLSEWERALNYLAFGDMELDELLTEEEHRESRKAICQEVAREFDECLIK